MSEDKDAFLSLSPVNGGGVISGNRDKSQITGNGVVNIPGLPQLKDVSYVEGLKLSLISIS